MGKLKKFMSRQAIIDSVVKEFNKRTNNSFIVSRSKHSNSV